MRYCDALSPSLLALATLGGGTQIGPLPFLPGYIVMHHLHWRSLLMKLLVTVTCDNLYCTCLGHLGRCDINRNGPICVPPPKVAKASKEGDNASQYRRWIKQNDSKLPQ